MKTYIIKTVAGWIAQWGGVKDFSADHVIAHIQTAQDSYLHSDTKRNFVLKAIEKAWPTIKGWAAGAVLELLLAYAIRKGLLGGSK